MYYNWCNYHPSPTEKTQGSGINADSGAGQGKTDIRFCTIKKGSALENIWGYVKKRMEANLNVIPQTKYGKTGALTLTIPIKNHSPLNWFYSDTKMI